MSARDKAERCFAVARSTTFDGERSNAIAQGTRIAEAAGLSLDLFDIPGREKRKPEGPSFKATNRSYRTEFGASTAEDLEELFRQQAAARARAADRAFYDTFYGRTAEQVRQQQERDRAAREAVRKDAEKAKQLAEDKRIAPYVMALLRTGASVKRASTMPGAMPLWNIVTKDGTPRICTTPELIEIASIAMRFGS